MFGAWICWWKKRWQTWEQLQCFEIGTLEIGSWKVNESFQSYAILTLKISYITPREWPLFPIPFLLVILALWYVAFSTGFLQAWANCAKLFRQNLFAEANQHVLTFLHPIVISRVTYCKQVEVLLVSTVFVLPKDSSLNILGYKGVFVAQNISMLVSFSRDGPNTRGPLHNLKWNSGIAYLVASIMPQEMGQSNKHYSIN